MKIALGVRCFRRMGGQEHFAIQLADHLVAHGHQVIVYTFQHDARPGVQIVPLPLPRFRPRFRRDWATGDALAKALLQSDADVTFGEQKTWGAHVVRPGGGIEATYWNYKSQRKWKAACNWVAPLCPKRAYDLHAERRAILSDHTKAIIVNSHLVRNALGKHYPTALPKVHVIHNGATLSHDNARNAPANRARIRHQYQIPEQAPVALFIGHDFHRKGLSSAISTLAQANQQAPDTPWHLLVAGRGRLTRYQRQAAHLRIGPYVHFCGVSTNSQALYAAADALLLPTHYDPFAAVTAEALGAGIPVLTTACNGGSEIIQQNHNGWIVPDPNCITEMAAHLNHAAAPHALAQLKQQALLISRSNRIEDRLNDVETLLTNTALQLRKREHTI